MQAQVDVGRVVDVVVSISDEVARHSRFTVALGAVVREVVVGSADAADVRVVSADVYQRQSEHSEAAVVVAVGDARSANAHRRALAAGAVALVDWWSPEDDIRAAIDGARHGFSLVPAGVSANLVSRLEDPPSSLELSDWQLELLRDLSEGLTLEELAAARRCSARKVRRHLREIWKLLGVDGRAQGLVRATRWGLVG